MARFEETMTQQKIPNFKACIKDINDAENAAPMFTLSSVGDLEIHTNNIGKDLLINCNTTLLLDSKSDSQDLRSDKGELYVKEGASVSPESSFVVGQVDNIHDNIVGLLKPNCNKNKSKGALKTKNGPSPNKPILAIRRSPRKGNLLSAQDGARVQKGAMQSVNEYVAKREQEHVCTSYDKSLEIKKKMRMEEETRHLSALLAEHLGSAEAVGQPHRAQ